MKDLKARLKHHYRASLQQSFRQFRRGAALFFVGLVIVYGASQLLAPSLAQEIMVLAGLAVLAGGFIIAIMAQCRMLIARLIRFWEKDRSH